MRDVPQVGPQSGGPNGDGFVSSIVLPDGAEAAQLARQFFADNSRHLRPELVEEAQLLVSEIVSNAFRHGRPDVTLRVRLDPPTIGVDVTDTGPGLPVLAHGPPAPTRASGRGLLIVDALASAWGVSPAEPPPGKAVWFELDASDPSA